MQRGGTYNFKVNTLQVVGKGWQDVINSLYTFPQYSQGCAAVTGRFHSVLTGFSMMCAVQSESLQTIYLNFIYGIERFVADNSNDVHDICDTSSLEKGKTSIFLDPYFQKPCVTASLFSDLSDDSGDAEEKQITPQFLSLERSGLQSLYIIDAIRALGTFRPLHYRAHQSRGLGPRLVMVIEIV